MSAPRVFVSYSRSDRTTVAKIVDRLKQDGFEVLWDADFVTGGGFTDQIQSGIAHAHVFIPVITPRARSRAWVDQEIGYAKALNVEIAPLVIGAQPKGVIAAIQTVPVAEDLSDLAAALARSNLRALATKTSSANPALYECAQTRVERSSLLAAYADRVFGMGHTGIVRQRGALTTFAVPDEPIDHPVWHDRYGPELDEHYVKCVRDERQAMERHAKKDGCRLIIRLDVRYDARGPKSKASRIETLLAFLTGNTHGETHAIVDDTPGAPASQPNAICVGTWFTAVSYLPDLMKGYRQTMLTRHASTVEEHVADFDKTFASLLQRQGRSLADCRDYTVARLRDALRNP